jgi:photosystem II stability/assembly factor-like uncharacterized protein
MRVMRLILLLTISIFATAQAPAPAQTPWQMQESGTTASLRGIDSVDGTIAWASGTGGTVLKTLDGGAHWTECAIPDAAKDGATLDFRGVQAWDATTAIVMASGPGDRSRLYKTTDGCRNWALIFKNPDAPEGFFDSFFVNWSLWAEGSDKLWWPVTVLGDPVNGRFVIFDSIDDGKTWRRRENPSLDLGGESLSGFAASNSLFAGSSDGNHIQVFGTGGKSGAEVWLAFPNLKDRPNARARVVDTPILHGTDSSGIFSLAYRQDLFKLKKASACDCGDTDARFALVAVGGDYSKPNDSTGAAASSADGGEHWIAATIQPHGYRSSVQWSEAFKLWITVGTNGSDISRDDGKTWQPLDDGNWNALSLPFVVGPNGRIARLNPAALPHSTP